MAESKKSIIVYADWIEKFEELTDEEAGKLIKHFFRYVNDFNPIAPDRTTKLMFIDMQNSLKRDLNKWENIKGKRSEAGKASAAAKKSAKEKLTNLTSVESVKQTLTKSTVSVSDNVSDSVSVNNIVVEEEKEIIYEKKEIEFFEEKIVSKSASTEIEEKPVIAAETEIDEEEYAAAEIYLKSQSRIYITLQSQQKITGAECLKLFRTFYEQKWGLEKSYGSGKEMIDNFFYWVPKHLHSTRPKPATQNGNANYNTRTSTKSPASHVKNREEREQLVNGLKSLLLGTEPK